MILNDVCATEAPPVVTIKSTARLGPASISTKHNSRVTETGHTDDSDTRNRGVKEFFSGVKESGGVE